MGVKLDGGSAGLDSGVQLVGNVGGKTVSVTIPLVVTASNSYGANYVVGGLLQFPNAFSQSGSGILQEVVINMKKVESSGFTFIPFASKPASTVWTDAAVAAISPADVFLAREPIVLISYSGLGTHTIYSATAIGQAMAQGQGQQDLFAVLIANAALTNQFAAADIVATIKVLQDA